MLMKICLVGDKSKSTLRERFLGRGFQSKYMMTIGADFALRRMDLNGQTIKFQIWDLAIQQQFRAVRSIYYLGTLGIVLVYDRANYESLENIFENWLPEIFRYVGSSLVSLVLVGNHSSIDQGDNSNQITSLEGQEAARRMIQIFQDRQDRNIEIPYIETSDETGINLNSVFEHLLRMYVENFARPIRPKFISESITHNPVVKEDHSANLKSIKLLINTFGGICHGCRRSSRGLLCNLCFNMFKKQYDGIPASIFFLGNYLFPLEYRPILIGDPFY